MATMGQVVTWVIMGIVPPLSRESDGERWGDNERRGGGEGEMRGREYSESNEEDETRWQGGKMAR